MATTTSTAEATTTGSTSSTDNCVFMHGFSTIPIRSDTDMVATNTGTHNNSTLMMETKPPMIRTTTATGAEAGVAVLKVAHHSMPTRDRNTIHHSEQQANDSSIPHHTTTNCTNGHSTTNNRKDRLLYSSNCKDSNNDTTTTTNTMMNGTTTSSSSSGHNSVATPHSNNSRSEATTKKHHPQQQPPPPPPPMLLLHPPQSPTTTTTTPPVSISIASDRVQYTNDTIIANYTYQTTVVHTTTTTNTNTNTNTGSTNTNGAPTTTTTTTVIQPMEQQMIFRTNRHVPKLGVMLVGLGGNNGCTCVAGTIANRNNMTWETKLGSHTSNYLGSIFMSSTTKIGNDYHSGQPVYKPLNALLPMIHPNDIIWSGWDINDMNLGDAMKRAKVLDYDLQQKLYPHMKDIVPLPSIYFPDYIAANQNDRANNVLSGTKYEQMNIIRQNIRDFRTEHNLNKVIVMWTANTERFTNVQDGIHDTATNLMASVQRNENEISASTIFAMASIYENCTFINGSPQNTFVPGVIELAIQHNVFIAGDDFKSGQTKMKSVLVDFLVSAGIKPLSIVSYNHLGNNDGKNLSAPSQFRSKEISKSNVVDDMVASNTILYPNIETDHPDHVVVIKYVPAVADSKRAMDEYTSEIFMGGKNTIVIHNTCEDSLLATPLIYDLIILAELCERITVKTVRNCYDNNSSSSSTTTENDEQVHQQQDDTPFESFHPVLSLLSYLLKAPLVPNGTPIVNALFPQREAITNVLRACLGLPPNNHMSLEHRFASSIQQQQRNSDNNDNQAYQNMNDNNGNKT